MGPALALLVLLGSVAITAISRFMGSEFAYEDISSQEVEKYGYSYVGE
jgi:hypothetical protein